MVKRSWFIRQSQFYVLSERKWIRTKRKPHEYVTRVSHKSVTHECAKTTEATQVRWSLYLGETILTLPLQVPFPVRLWSTTKGTAAAHSPSLHVCTRVQDLPSGLRKERGALAITLSLRKADITTTLHAEKSDTRIFKSSKNSTLSA